MTGEHAPNVSLTFVPTQLSGIDVVRNKIKTFAQKKVTLPPGRHKIIILDEADRSVQFKLRTFLVLRSNKHDTRRAASLASYHGNFLQHDAFLPRLQYEQQDYRAHTK